jgi:hypothetical protein
MKPIVFDRARGLPLAAAASLALVLAAAGCGGHGTKPTASAPTRVVPPATTTPVTPTPVTPTPAPGPSTPGPTSIVPVPTTPAGPGRCHTADLSARLRSLDPAAGSRYEVVVLTNRSTTTCRVYGYGGVQLLDAARRPLPTDQVREPSTPPRLVILRPGTSAYSRLHWSVVPTDTESQTGPCEPASTYLLITPPDETQPITVAWSQSVCSHGRIGQGAYRSSSVPD